MMNKLPKRITIKCDVKSWHILLTIMLPSETKRRIFIGFLCFNVTILLPGATFITPSGIRFTFVKNSTCRQIKIGELLEVE